MHTPIRLDALAEEKETTAVKQRSKKRILHTPRSIYRYQETRQERN
jgi:hypothetical protein